MAITYKELYDWGITVPVLHKVVYATAKDNGAAPLGRFDPKDARINAWLEHNCKHPYYHSPGYSQEKFIQFECDEEAFLFALHWSGAN